MLVVQRGRCSAEALRLCIHSQHGMVLLLGLPVVVAWALRVAGAASLPADDVTRCRACILFLHEVANARVMFSHKAPNQTEAPPGAPVSASGHLTRYMSSQLSAATKTTIQRIDAIVQSYLVPRVSSGRYDTPLGSANAEVWPWMGSLSWAGRLFGRPPPFVPPPPAMPASWRPLGHGALTQWLHMRISLRASLPSRAYSLGTSTSTGTSTGAGAGAGAGTSEVPNVQEASEGVTHLPLNALEGVCGPLLQAALNVTTNDLFARNARFSGANNPNSPGAPWNQGFLDDVAAVVACYLHTVLWTRLASTDGLSTLETPLATLLWHMSDRLLPTQALGVRAPLLGEDGV